MSTYAKWRNFGFAAYFLTNSLSGIAQAAKTEHDIQTGINPERDNIVTLAGITKMSLTSPRTDVELMVTAVTGGGALAGKIATEALNGQDPAVEKAQILLSKQQQFNKMFTPT